MASQVSGEGGSPVANLARMIQHGTQAEDLGSVEVGKSKNFC